MVEVHSTFINSSVAVIVHQDSSVIIISRGIVRHAIFAPPRFKNQETTHTKRTDREANCE